MNLNPGAVISFLLLALAAFATPCRASSVDPTDNPSLLPTSPKEWVISDDLQVKRIQPGVWMHTSWKTYPDGSRFASNGLIIREGNAVTLVDTPWGTDATTRLLEWIESNLECSVARALITHAHEDRLAGAPVLSGKGISMLAESRTVALAELPAGVSLASLGSLEAGEATDLGELEVLFPGAGHSSDNIVVWIPMKRILFAGCLVKAADAVTLGNTMDADLVHWSDALELIQERYGDAELVIPGHGLEGGLGLLDHTLALLAGPKAAAERPIPVILDTDIGSDIDDTWALVYLLRSPEFDPRLILTATGDTVYRAQIVARFLKLAGRTDIPIGLGLRGSASHEYQKPWVTNSPLDAYPGTVFVDGVQQLIDIVHASPVPVTIIAIGPTGNIAEALRRDPSIAPKARFVGMHGSIDVGYGEGPPVAEANVRGDVPAFRVVLQADWMDIQITPLDTCGNISLEGERYQRVRQSKDPVLEALIENYRIWANLVTWVKVDFFETRSSTLFDVVALFMAHSCDYLEFETIPLRVTDDGMTLRDPNGVPIRVAMRWNDRSAFLDHLTTRLLPPQATASKPSSDPRTR